ncbi:MAG TPA: ABC-2 family transporter protein [Candidatus Dormibacteraeota bacterium]|jgi:ABC-2 type transport system permease protein|nr:ABC-2 family transporter protein [Candidatus Dormibacteraeota bacterium]
MGVERLLRLWAMRATMNASQLLRSRGELLAWSVTSVIGNVGSITGTFLIAQRFDGIGRWSRSEILFMLGFAVLVNALLNALAGFNVGMVSRRIGRGQMDHTLLQPQPLWLSLMTEGFAPLEELGAITIGAGLIAIAARGAGVHASPAWVALLVLQVLSSLLILIAYQYAWGSVAFWTPRAAEEINTRTSSMTWSVANLPLDGVYGWLRVGLLTAIPTGFVAWLPCRALLGIEPAYPAALILTPAAAAVFAAIAILVFRKGLDHYVRTGSSRYSTFGHRR